MVIKQMRPNLVNPNLWSPFQSIPIRTSQIPIQVEIETPRILTKREVIQKNSIFLNFVGIILILGISYFLYSVYLERKIFAEYLEYLQNNQQEYPGFF
jgi:hypothetical protein